MSLHAHRTLRFVLMLSAYRILRLFEPRNYVVSKPMRYKRTKNSRKYLKYLEKKGNFRKPYQVLVEETFLDNFNRYKHSMHSFKLLMLGEPKFFISECCYKAYQKLYSHDNDFIKHCKIKRCSYPCGSTLECVLGTIRKKNKHHFFVAASDPQLVDKLMATHCVPVIAVAKGGLCFAAKRNQDVRSADEEDYASDTSLKGCALNKHCSE